MGLASCELLHSCKIAIVEPRYCRRIKVVSTNGVVPRVEKEKSDFPSNID